MPGMASAHSHAFQRALRGRTQSRNANKRTAAGNFWSWRDQMFQLVAELTPDDVLAISRFAFVELAMSGVTAVGEFHYVHHDVGGKPYANRLVMSEAVIQAAAEAGIRLSLIRTGYYRAGYGQTLHEGQKRFCDTDSEQTLRDVQALTALAADKTDYFRVALAAHSIRACQQQQYLDLSAYAKQHRLPFHMHVSEQQREVDECVAEYGKRPVELLADDGVLDERFVAIHATHLLPHESALMGRANAIACICRTTERDLGDGLPVAADLAQAGVRFCVGADSHAASDAFEEVRAIELDERARHERRIVAAQGEALLVAATTHGYAAIGYADMLGQDQVYLRADDPSIADAMIGNRAESVADAVVFGANARAVDRVIVGGKEIVTNGRHIHYDTARAAYLACLRRLS